MQNVSCILTNNIMLVKIGNTTHQCATKDEALVLARTKSMSSDDKVEIYNTDGSLYDCYWYGAKYRCDDTLVLSQDELDRINKQQLAYPTKEQVERVIKILGCIYGYDELLDFDTDELLSHWEDDGIYYNWYKEHSKKMDKTTL